MTSSATTTTDKGDDLPPGLLDVCSLVLPFFDSTELAQLGSTSKSWSETTTASSLPLVLRRELVTSRALPDRLVMSIDEMEGESLGHWRRFAQQWASKTFVRADLGTIDAVAPPAKEDIVADNDLTGDDDDKEVERETAQDVLPDISTLKIREMKSELKTYGIDCSAFCEKSELVAALQEARADQKSGAGGYDVVDDALGAFLAKPEVADCLIGTPEEVAARLRSAKNVTTLGELGTSLLTNHPTAGTGPKSVLSGKQGGVKKDRWDAFQAAVLDTYHVKDHYILIEITAQGKTLTLEDGTPLRIWMDGMGQCASPDMSKFPGGDDEEGDEEEESLIGCLADYGAISSDTICSDFFFTKFMRGCEDNCYGRMVIHEDDIDGLSFDNSFNMFEGTPAEVDLPEDYDLCHHPTDQSLNGLFDVTVKAVSFHKDCGPAVVTIAHQEPLQLISSRPEFDSGCVETLGAIRYHFKSGELKNEDGTSFTIAASFKNCAMLLNFDPLEFEEGMVIAQKGERPTSNQLWVLDWNFAVLEGDRSKEHCIGIWENKPKVSLARSEISRKCGLIKGL